MEMQDYIEWLKTHDLRGRPIDTPQPTGPMPSIDPNSRVDQAGNAILGLMNPLSRFQVGRVMQGARNALPQTPQGSSGVPNISNATPQMQPYQFPQGGPSGPTSSIPPGYLNSRQSPLPPNFFSGPRGPTSDIPVRPNVTQFPIRPQPATTTAILNAPQVQEQQQSNYDNWPDRVRQMPTGPTPNYNVTPPPRPAPQQQAPAPQPKPQTYWLDRGDGSPLTPMGENLPKGVGVGDNPGMGRIFGVDKPTKNIFGFASGGDVDHASRIAREKATPCHSGIINMAVGGRTDHIPMNVLEGSYVLPADIVSGLGEGNTLAGSKILDQMFSSGPFGTKKPNFQASTRYPSPGYTPKVSSPYQPVQVSAKGGKVEPAMHSRPVPIIAAGGEYVIHPETVRELGKGDMDAGHKYLDNFVKYVRDHTVKTMRNLPPPRKD